MSQGMWWPLKGRKGKERDLFLWLQKRNTPLLKHYFIPERFESCKFWMNNLFFCDFFTEVVSDSLLLQGLQNARLPCPSLSHMKLAQILVQLVSNAIKPSHPLSSPSPAVLNLSQHQGLFQWVSSASGGQSIGASASASVLPMNSQSWFPLGLTGLISLQSKGLSRVFSNTTNQKNQFFGAQLSSQSNSHIHTWPLEKP